jgi:hypothetical protein
MAIAIVQLTYADVCWRMLTYADVCWHMLPARKMKWPLRLCSQAPPLDEASPVTQVVSAWEGEHEFFFIYSEADKKKLGKNLLTKTKEIHRYVQGLCAYIDFLFVWTHPRIRLVWSGSEALDEMWRIYGWGLPKPHFKKKGGKRGKKEDVTHIVVRGHIHSSVRTHIVVWGLLHSSMRTHVVVRGHI